MYSMYFCNLSSVCTILVLVFLSLQFSYLIYASLLFKEPIKRAAFSYSKLFVYFSGDLYLISWPNYTMAEMYYWIGLRITILNWDSSFSSNFDNRNPLKLCIFPSEHISISMLFFAFKPFILEKASNYFLNENKCFKSANSSLASISMSLSLTSLIGEVEGVNISTASFCRLYAYI